MEEVGDGWATKFEGVTSIVLPDQAQKREQVQAPLLASLLDEYVDGGELLMNLNMVRVQFQ
jgi:hypothetical protein